MSKQIKYMDVPAFYDFFAADHPSFKEKQDFFLQPSLPHESICELGAGTGNIALHLAANNKKISCVEPSLPVLNVLWSKVEQNKLYSENVTILPQTAQDFQLLTPADLIIAPNLLHLVVKEKQRRAILQNIKKNIIQGGKVILTFFNQKEVNAEEKKLTAERQIGDVLYRRYSELAPVKNKRLTLSLITWHFEVVYNGLVVKKCKEEFLCRYDTEKYVTKLLTKNGFSVEDIYSDYKLSPYSKELMTDNLIIVAKAG